MCFSTQDSDSSFVLVSLVADESGVSLTPSGFVPGRFGVRPAYISVQGSDSSFILVGLVADGSGVSLTRSPPFLALQSECSHSLDPVVALLWVVDMIPHLLCPVGMLKRPYDVYSGCFQCLALGVAGLSSRLFRFSNSSRFSLVLAFRVHVCSFYAPV